MNFELAVQLLELPTNFTQDDLKKSFHKKVKEYHPDQIDYYDYDDNLIKKINEAYNYLSKKLRNNETLLSNFKKNYLIEINKFREYSTDVVYPNYFYLTLEDIISVIINFEKSINNLNSGSDLSKLFISSKLFIQSLYIDLLNTFCLRNNIDSKLLNSINYNTSIGNFFNQLLNYKKEIEDEKKKNLKLRIQNECNKYKTYDYYNILAKTVDKIIADYEIKAFLSRDYNSILLDMHNEINTVFNNYYKIIEKCNEIEKWINSIQINNEDITIFINLLNNFKKELNILGINYKKNSYNF